jgi:hypothetical protein
MSSMQRRPPAVPLKRRALVGAAWVLAWTLVWASALLLFAAKVHG